MEVIPREALEDLYNHPWKYVENEEKEQKSNFCCDCYYAKKTGFIFKTWRCTNEEVNKAHLTGGNFKYDICPVTAKARNKQGRKRFISCNEARHQFYLKFLLDDADYYGVIHHCEFYKGNYRCHPFAPPIKNRLPIPPKETPMHNPPERKSTRRGKR